MDEIIQILLHLNDLHILLFFSLFYNQLILLFLNGGHLIDMDDVDEMKHSLHDLNFSQIL